MYCNFYIIKLFILEFKTEIWLSYLYFLAEESMIVRVVVHRDNDDSESVVSSVECIVCAYYSRTSSDVPGIVQQTIRLPLSLAYDVHWTPCSDFSWSAKILVDESPVPIKTLFKGKV